ncbi:MAG: hypothetical protein NTW03_11415 [Verrucomicrobia bacterium]|nr:hypothetical protein [Verrucomicrobiota bacterium]
MRKGEIKQAALIRKIVARLHENFTILEKAKRNDPEREKSLPFPPLLR